MGKQTIYPEVTFTESELTGRPPIARLGCGKICLLHHSISPKSIKAGETWRCQIIAEEDTKVIIIPIELLVSKKRNEKIFKEKLELLKLKFA